MPHFVYALVDPVTDEIRYVGLTGNPRSRFLQHCNVAKEDLSTKANWIRGLKANNLLPGLKIIETLDNEFHLRDRENYWITHYLKAGANLTNLMIPYEPVVWGPPKLVVTVSKEDLGKALTAALTRKSECIGKYSLRRLAIDNGFDYASLHRLFHGKTLPSRNRLMKICIALDCSWQEMDKIFEFALYKTPTPEELEEERAAVA